MVEPDRYTEMDAPTLSGKALMGLLPRGAQVSGGRALFAARSGKELDLLALPPRKMQRNATPQGA